MINLTIKEQENFINTLQKLYRMKVDKADIIDFCNNNSIFLLQVSEGENIICDTLPFQVSQHDDFLQQKNL